MRAAPGVLELAHLPDRTIGLLGGPGFGIELDRDALACAAELNRKDDRFSGH
jgi:hypothetical protein